MTRRAFTLIELLIVIAIVAVLALIAMVNYRLGIERSMRSADASNLHTIATALQSYLTDYNELPPADREAGPFMSHTPEFAQAMNGPAAGGSWDGIPWLLIEKGYITDWKTLFCPKYLKLYRGGTTLRGGHPRYHNFRYAYNTTALSSAISGSSPAVMSGTVWIVRDLWLSPRDGFFGSSYPDYPADYSYPWGEGDLEGQVELAIYADMAVRQVVGGKNTRLP